MAQKTQIWSLYRITNKINGKVYIGQAQDYQHRWADHRRAAKINKPIQIIHHALIKYGLSNFEFKVIASCKTQDDANELETLLVAQYNSHVSSGKGYNATLGGMNAPKTEEWKQKVKLTHQKNMKDPKFRAMKTEVASKMQQRYRRWLADNGLQFPGFQKGHEVKTEWREATRLANSGKVHSEETKIKRVQSLLKHYKKFDYPMDNYTPPMFNKKHTPEAKAKMSAVHKGQHHSPETEFKPGASPTNKKVFTEAQIEDMKLKRKNGYSLKSIAMEYHIDRSVVTRILKAG